MVGKNDLLEQGIDAVDGQNAIEIQWRAPSLTGSPPDGYRIYRRQAARSQLFQLVGEFRVGTRPGLPDTTYIDADTSRLSATSNFVGTRFDYVVRGFVGSAESANSDTATYRLWYQTNPLEVINDPMTGQPQRFIYKINPFQQAAFVIRIGEFDRRGKLLGVVWTSGEPVQPDDYSQQQVEYDVKNLPSGAPSPPPFLDSQGRLLLIPGRPYRWRVDLYPDEGINSFSGSESAWKDFTVGPPS